MSNKKVIFEHSGGNVFRIASPQPIGMVAETNPPDEAYYRDAKDYENMASDVRRELEVIKQAGLDKQYEALMNGIFALPIQEFDKRADAIEKLTQKAFQMTGQQRQ